MSLANETVKATINMLKEMDTMTTPPTPAEMPKADFLDHAGDRTWAVSDDGTTSIERFATEQVARAERAEDLLGKTKRQRDAAMKRADEGYRKLKVTRALLDEKSAKYQELKKHNDLVSVNLNDLAEEKEDLSAENERLREALETIGNGDVDYKNGQYEAQSLANELYAIKSFAYAALHPTTKGDEDE